MKTSGKILLYSLYTLVVICVFLYSLFPAKMVSDLIMARLAAVSPDLQLRMQGAHPVFPPGLKFEPLEVAYAGIPIVRMDYLKVLPSLFSALSSEKQLAFRGSLGNGSLKGHVALTADEQRPQTKFTLNLAEVSVDVFEVFDRWPGYQLAGDLSMYMDYDSKKGAGGTANIRMDITPTKITFSPALMGLEQIEFSQIQTEMTVTPRMLQIKSCDFSGQQIEGKITGSIVFRRPMQNSRLTLSCTIKPQPAFLAEHKNSIIAGLLGSESAQKRGIVLRIAGTLEKPSYVVR